MPSLCPTLPAETAEGKPHDSQFRVVLSDSLSISGTASPETNVFCSKYTKAFMDSTAQTAGSYTEPVSIEETSHSWTHRAVYHATSLHFAFLEGKAKQNITLQIWRHAHTSTCGVQNQLLCIHAHTEFTLPKPLSKSIFQGVCIPPGEKPVLSLRKVAFLLQIGAIRLSCFLRCQT